jgi:phytoene dehydrogenase-like protein
MAEAAREAGATIRLDAPVRRITVANGRAQGVVLQDGAEIPAAAVISNADPRRTLLTLVDPIELDPGILQRLRNYRMPGTVAKVNLALGRLPPFSGIANPADLHGRIHIGPSLDYLEKAYDASKYGAVSQEPFLDITIPSLLDPDLCPANRHQYAPHKLAAGTDWTRMRDELASTVVRTIERYSPGFSNAVEQRLVLTPVDLEERYGLTNGHIHHGELALDQLFTMRPVLGYAQYRTPIEGLFLCGAGTHPGGGVSGLSGRNAAREIARSLKR